MTPDPEAFASLICDYCLEVGAREQIMVSATTLAEEAVMSLQAAILERGAWPMMRLSLPDQEVEWLRHATDAHLDAYSPSEAADAEVADKYLIIQAPADPGALSAVDPKLKARRDAARAPLGKIRLARRWCGTLWPTEGLARFAGMGVDDFRSFVSSAMFLDRPDPVAAWGSLRERQALLVDRLARSDQIRIQAEGTDLTLRVGERTWVNSDGRRNMPSGEVFTGPREDSAEGTIYFSLPSAHQGAKVSGVRLVFAEGEVVSASAEEGQAYLDAMLEADPGARRLGEIGIGTNFGIDRPIANILFDEKIGGTVHLALGRSYPETGGLNASSIHWDLICDLRDGGSIAVDGEPLDVRLLMG